MGLVLVVRLILSAVLVVMVSREAGPWTATAIALGVAGWELAAWRMR